MEALARTCFGSERRVVDLSRSGTSGMCPFKF
jgi:hypothetical protein